MSRFNRSVSAVCLFSCAVFAVSTVARAGEIKVYDQKDHVPSVEELGAALSGSTKKVKFRSLQFGGEASSSQTETTAPVDAVSLPIHFGYGSAQILPESGAYVDVVGQLMSQKPTLRFVVEGHTDAVGQDDYNYALSQQRAIAVRGYLVNRYRIDPTRLQPVGLGKSAPLPGENPLSPKNRRVQFRPVS